ncbi:2845_t:CDS:2, partial [Dentiscutata erythropus]
DNNNWLENNIHEIIKSRREEIKKTPIVQKLKSDMLTMFLTVNTERDVTEKIADDLHDKPMSDDQIIPNFMEAISAGTSSGGNSICFLVYFLENYPKVKQRMIEEIE